MKLLRFVFQNEKREALLAITGSSLIWGFSAPVLKVLLSFTPVFLLAFLRFFIAPFLLLVTKPDLRIEKKDIHKIIFAAFVGISLHIPLFFYGLSMSSVTNAVMINASAPILTLLFAREFLKEKIQINMIIGGIIGILGFGIVFLQPILNGDLDQNMLGNILILLAVLTWIYYEILCKKLIKKYNPITIAFYTSLIGGVSLFPLALPHFPRLLELISNPIFVYGTLYSIVFTSAIAFSFWQWGLSKLEVSRVGFFLYIDPIVASAIAVVFLGETLTTHFLTGGALIFFGLYIAESTIHLPHLHLHKAKR